MGEISVKADGMAGGTHVADGPLTTVNIREVSGDLLRNDVDSRVARVRPMATPVDQISRMIGARRAASMVVDYYSVDTKAQSARGIGDLKALNDQHGSGRTVYEIATDNDNIFAPTDTIMVMGAKGVADSSGEAAPALVLYVVGRGEGGQGLHVIAVNAGESGETDEEINGKTLVRMGRAAAELDVQTPQFEALPRKARNYCQIFKAQVEQSILARQSAKETGWTFSDQEEVAIMDMRLGMEKSFLFGTKARVTDPLRSDEVLFTGGIWNQAGSDFSYTTINENTLIDLMKSAFTGTNAGSGRKVLLAGSELTALLNKISYTRVAQASDKVTHWGIDFSEIRSKFGSLYVIHAEVFDQCGHEYDGLVIDPEYLVKYVHVPFKVERLDLRKSGQRNTEAVVATEASCLALRHPKSYVRVTRSV